MAQSNNILQELRELESSLAGMTSQSVYTVPKGYFQGLAETVLERIRIEAEPEYLSPVLNEVSRVMPYTVPAGYFEGLASQVLDSINTGNPVSVQEELADLSPLLGGLKKEMPYSIPAGYFDKPAGATGTRPAKLVSLAGRKWFRFAAAAVLMAAVATTVVLISTKDRIDPSTNSYSWVEKKMKKVSTDEIKNFVDMSDETLPQKEIVASADKSNEVKEMIKDIPASEIQEFLSVIPQEETNLDDEVILN